MRATVFGLLLCAGLVCVTTHWWSAENEALAQLPDALRGVARGELIALSADSGKGFQQVTLIDPKRRVMSVYHIDFASGEIALKSVRNVNWDLQMEEFNGISPSPREIRNLHERR
jgi:hypothetical protein